MHLRLLLATSLLFASGCLSAATPVVTLENGKTIALTAAVLAPVQRISVSATAHGKTATYEGYDLAAILKAVGADPVASVRGKRLVESVLVSAADNYRVRFSLSELDPTLGNHQVLLVDRENGGPLSAGDGPWRLVVPSDKRPARWVRQVGAAGQFDRALKSLKSIRSANHLFEADGFGAA